MDEVVLEFVVVVVELVMKNVLAKGVPVVLEAVAIVVDDMIAP